MIFIFLSSSHLEDRIWFRDEEDFKVGMNCVALAAVKTGAGVVVFVLMSNHVHFLLMVDNPAQAKAFFDFFKNLYSIYVHKKYGTKRFLRENQCDYSEVSPSSLDEGLERVIAYILMNPVAANIVANAFLYRWGCGECFFSQRAPRGKKAGTLSGREKARLLKTTLKIPDSFIISEDGYILPESYILKDFVQSVFHTPKRLNFHLYNSSKARQVIEGAPPSLPSFRDQSLVSLAQDIAVSLFRKDSLSELDTDERRLMIQEVKRRTGADIKQLTRVLGLSHREIAELE